MGPDHLVVAGQSVTVARKDGSTSEVYVEDVSAPFFEDGERKRWGYILDREPPRTGTLF